MTAPRGGTPRRVCVLGLGGGGFHFEIEQLVSQLPADLELVLVYAIHTQVHGNWRSPARAHRAFVVRSPALLQDSWLQRLRASASACWRAAAILLATRPDCVLAVGTAQAVPFALGARLAGLPMIFVESVTRVDGSSRTARLLSALRLTTSHYVQWPGLILKGRRRFSGSLVS